VKSGWAAGCSPTCEMVITQDVIRVNPSLLLVPGFVPLSACQRVGGVLGPWACWAMCSLFKDGGNGGLIVARSREKRAAYLLV